MCSEYDYHAGKRRWRRSVPEPQASAYKPDFSGFMVDELMKIAGVCTGGDEHHDRRPGVAGLAPAFEHPVVNRPSVRRVAEYGLSAPVLLQPVVRCRVELSALGIRRRGAGVEREAELGVERVEERLRGRPVHPGG